MQCVFFFRTGKENIETYVSSFSSAHLRSRLATNNQILDALPKVLDAEAFVNKIKKADREATVRYLGQQSKKYLDLVLEMFGEVEGETIEAHQFVALDGRWRDFASGTIGYERRSNMGGLFILFDEWSINASGKIQHTPRPVEVSPKLPAEQVDIALYNIPQKVTDTIFDIMNYVGFGLTGTGWPVLGTVLSGLASVIKQWVEPAFNEQANLLKEIKQLLDANRIENQIEEAGFTIDTWKDYRDQYFNPAWLNDLMDPKSDPNSEQFKDKQAKLQKYADKINKDFTGTPRLFDAVNETMSRPATINEHDLRQPTEGMFKFSAFLYFSNLVLLFGKEAWLTQYTIDDRKDKETKRKSRLLAESVAYHSEVYTKYASKLTTAIDNQINERAKCVTTQDDDPNDEMDVIDNYFFGYKRPHTVARLGYHYCGRDEKEKALAAAEAAAEARCMDYVKTLTPAFCNKFFQGGYASIKEKTNKMVENDKKLQALKTKGT